MRTIALPTCLIAAQLIGQPIYDTPIAPGQEFQVKRKTSVDPILTLAAGEDQTWDLSFLAGTATLDCLFDEAAASALHDEFPSGSVFRQLGSDEEHYAVNGAHVDLVGELFGSDVRTYSDPARRMVVPFTYMSSWTDLLTATWTDTGIDFIVDGILQAEVIGHGTVLLPGGTFPGALLVREEQDLVFIQDGDANDLTRYIDRLWLPGLSMPLVQSLRTVQMYGNDTIGDTYTVHYVHAILSSVAGIGEPAQSLDLFPNPCSEAVFARFANDAVPEFLGIYTLSGQLVESVRPGQAVARIQTSALPQGVYTVVARYADGSRAAAPLAVLRY